DERSASSETRREAGAACPCWLLRHAEPARSWPARVVVLPACRAPARHCKQRAVPPGQPPLGPRQLRPCPPRLAPDLAALASRSCASGTPPNWVSRHYRPLAESQETA